MIGKNQGHETSALSENDARLAYAFAITHFKHKSHYLI